MKNFKFNNNLLSFSYLNNVSIKIMLRIGYIMFLNARY